MIKSPEQGCQQRLGPNKCECSFLTLHRRYRNDGPGVFNTRREERIPAGDEKVPCKQQPDSLGPGQKELFAGSRWAVLREQQQTVMLKVIIIIIMFVEYYELNHEAVGLTVNSALKFNWRD